MLNAYTYNNANRLKTVTVAANLKATYTYDAAQHLAIRVLTNMTPSGTIHTVYDRDGNLLMENNGLLAGPTREYVWLRGTQIAPAIGAQARVTRPIAVVDAVNTSTPVTWWVQTDHLNRPVSITDGAKASVWQATWKPFGEPQAITGSATLDARFPGQWFQLESGLHQNWWRQYDPTTGRYTQIDPLGFVDGPSVYDYVGGEPSSFVDPSGLELLQNGTMGPLKYGDIWEAQLPEFPDAQVYVSNGRKFIAPKSADWCSVKASGQTNGYFGINAAVGHNGTFDWQRKGGHYHPEYIDASNYSVGVYMNGVGASQNFTDTIAGTFSFLFSKNKNDPKQKQWWDNGWTDSDSSSLDCSCHG